MKQTFVGAGNSGGKQEAMPMDFAAVMLSKKTGRPVRIVHTMEEVLTIGHMRHAFRDRPQDRRGQGRDDSGGGLSCHC